MTELFTFESQVNLITADLVAVMMHLFYSIYPLWIVHWMARERMSPHFQTLSTMRKFWLYHLLYYWRICYFHTAFIVMLIIASNWHESIIVPTLDLILGSIVKFLIIVLQMFALTAAVVLVSFVVANAFKKPLSMIAAIIVWWQLIAFAIACEKWNRNETEYSRHEMFTFAISYLMLFLSAVVFRIITFVMFDIFWHSSFRQNLFTRFRLVFGFQRYFLVQLYLSPN